MGVRHLKQTNAIPYPMRRTRYALPLALAGVLLWPGMHAERRTVYLNAHLITLASGSSDAGKCCDEKRSAPPSSSDHDCCGAMLVVGEHIAAVGGAVEAQAWITAGTRIVDLGGRTVMPGFVDAHSHFPSSGIRQVAVDLSAPPIGTVATRDALLQAVAEAAAEQSGDRWLLGYNYDNTAFADGRHPTRAELDVISGDHPVYLWHSSGHMGVANSKALAELGIDESSPNPPGGAIGRDLASGLLSGLLQEQAAPSLEWLLQKLPRQALWQIFTQARDEYLAAGVTSVQNGFAGAAMIRILDVAERLGVLPQRVLVWPAHEKLGAQLLTRSPRNGSRTGFRRGAVKLIVDGSPQGLTAHLSLPYFAASGAPHDHVGIATLSAADLRDLVLRYHTAGYQLAIHGNGDAAIDDILDAIAAAQIVTPRIDARHMLVHAQVLRRDQVRRLRELDVTPSFFTAHTWYWGDWHRRRSLGPARAADISPAGWARDAGLRFSLHADTPVTPMLPMQMLWSATQRQTQAGVVLGAHQRITRLQALRALTLDAAWQNFVDDSRGSLEPGKLADFIVLSDDPLSAGDVREIRVLQTFIGGREAWRDAVPSGE